MKRHFQMLAAYNRWANTEIYAAAGELTEDEINRDLGAFFRSALGTLNHILVGDRIWLNRFAGEAPYPMDAAPFPTLGALKAARTAEDKRIIDWVDGLTDAALVGRFTYTAGVDKRTVSQGIAPALAHLFNHQTHHRGQVHMILTALGRPSIVLDLIPFLRTEEGREFG